jgi:hypothetical protein
VRHLQNIVSLNSGQVDVKLISRNDLVVDQRMQYQEKGVTREMSQSWNAKADNDVGCVLEGKVQTTSFYTLKVVTEAGLSIDPTRCR